MQTPSVLRAGFCVFLGFVLSASVVHAGEARVLKTQKEKTSYAFGVDLGKSLRQRSIDMDPELFSQGLRDALAGRETLLTDDEVRAAIASLQNEQKTKLLAKHKREAQEFLAANQKKAGVVTLPNGLQYKILKTGAGKKPTLEDTVVCHYRGALLDGTELDSSYKRNQPVTFPVKAAMKGWVEALQLMPAGSKWQLFVPAHLASSGGAAVDFGPHAALTFEVELISVLKKP